MAVKGWQVVFRGGRIQADVVAAVLDSGGLRVEVLGDYSWGATLIEAQVLVPEDQARRARELIRQAEAAAPGSGEADV